VGLAKAAAAADSSAKGFGGVWCSTMFRLTGDEDLLLLYKELTTDETHGAESGGKLPRQSLGCGGDGRTSLVVAALPALIQDEQDGVRLLAVAALAGREHRTEHCTWTIQTGFAAAQG
jgi:hypothetical protein